MSGQILLVAGLPGSGKTTLLSGLEKEGWLSFDDFKAGAFFDSPQFRNARRYSDLLKSLKAGRNCVVADIDFCNSAPRAEAEFVILAEVPDVALNWLFFAPDVNACSVNIERRNRPSKVADIEALYRYARLYVVPPGATIKSVEN
jgi:predicted kinase